MHTHTHIVLKLKKKINAEKLKFQSFWVRWLSKER